MTIALAGNANVGKSVIFNQLTGSHQTIGNWPGKTVEQAVGSLNVGGTRVTLVDLPGIYSMSTFSLEEVVSREYIAREKPDAIINVIGAPVLERNLFFTLQLLEMDAPLVVCLNQVDIARSKGIVVDAERLSALLGVPVIPTVAAQGEGIRELVAAAVKAARSKETRRNIVRLGEATEAAAARITALMAGEGLCLDYPSHWVSVKLLEEDAGIKALVAEKSPKTAAAAGALVKELEETHQQPGFTVIASERYAVAARIALEVQRQAVMKPTFSDRLDRFATHRVFGYVTALAVVTLLLLWTFTAGSVLSGILSQALSFFEPVDPRVNGPLISILWNGLFGGFVAGVTLVIPYVAPFYLMLAALEDSGILTRVAFMMDSAMHQMGLHGKAIIPIILGYGCNVPAIYSTRIMGTRRERLLAAFAITFAPCTARTIIIMGMVAAFVGIWWALGLYLLLLIIMFAAVRVSARALPGDLTGLIMEMHSFKVPSLSVMARQTWARTKSLIIMVFPIYMIASAAAQGAYALGLLEPVARALSFLTVNWLGLPVIAGVLLLFGLARKELILIMAVVLLGTDLSLVLTTPQLIVLAFVGSIYPCLATIGVLTKEFGWRPAWTIIAANLATAILLGGILMRLLGLII